KRECCLLAIDDGGPSLRNASGAWQGPFSPLARQSCEESSARQSGSSPDETEWQKRSPAKSTRQSARRTPSSLPHPPNQPNEGKNCARNKRSCRRGRPDRLGNQTGPVGGGSSQSGAL